MSVKELMDLIVAAIGDLQGLCKSYIGVPYTACTVEEFSHRCFLILERYNLHLRKVLGIELYLVVGANFDDFNTNPYQPSKVPASNLLSTMFNVYACP
mgnify:CR=1 FL=1